jgi:hypothetical protein
MLPKSALRKVGWTKQMFPALPPIISFSALFLRKAQIQKVCAYF